MVSDVIEFVKTIFSQILTWMIDLYNAVGAWSYIIPMFIIFIFVGYVIWGSPGGSSGSDAVSKNAKSDKVTTNNNSYIPQSSDEYAYMKRKGLL